MDSIHYIQEEMGSSFRAEELSLDCFIIAGGSDSRAYEVLRLLLEKGAQIKRIIFFEFNERLDVEGKELEKFKEITKFDISLDSIKVSIGEPSSGIKKLTELINKEKFAESNVGIDITCFPKPYFFSILNYLDKYVELRSVEVFYTEPQSYLFKTGLYTSYHSSNGPVRNEVIPSFVGADYRDTRRVLIIFLGFDGDLAKEASIEIDPNETVLFNGLPSYVPKFKDISIISNESLINDKNRLLYSQANNPFKVYNALDKLKKEHPNKTNFDIVPLGSKPMALGACLFAVHNSDIRVIYPIPEKYENVTTKNCLRSWYYSIPLKPEDA
ncbi:MAG: hypothetical protein WED10_06440 [Brumimicrobium sp.]